VEGGCQHSTTKGKGTADDRILRILHTKYLCWRINEWLIRQNKEKLIYKGTGKNGMFKCKLYNPVCALRISLWQLQVLAEIQLICAQKEKVEDNYIP
jgi:hypothetical protein